MVFFKCSEDMSIIQEPFFSFLKSSNITIDTVEKAANVWEYGFKFTPLQSGIVKQLGIKVPAIGNFKVKLYNLITNSVIVDTIIESKAKGTESFIEVENLKLSNNTNYGLSIVADVFFKVKQNTGAVFVFPQVIGSIQVYGFFEEKCGANGCAVFPVALNDLVIAPCVSFKFQAD